MIGRAVHHVIQSLTARVAGLHTRTASHIDRVRSEHRRTRAFDSLEGRALLSSPHVIGSSFIYDELPHRVMFQFDQDVSASLSTNDLYVHRYGFDATRYPASRWSLTYDNATNVATFSWTGTTSGHVGMMPSGFDYAATLYADDVTNADGEPLAATSSFDFFFMVGDANHDRASEQSDLDLVLAGENSPPTSPLFSLGDYDYSGVIDADDEALVSFTTMKRLRKYGSTLSVYHRADDTRELQWIDDCPYDNGYIVQVSDDGKNFITLAQTAPNATSFVDDISDPSVQHYYRIRAALGSNESAIEASGYSAAKSELDGNTLETPETLDVSNVAHNSVTLTWPVTDLTATSYEILRSNPAGGWVTLDASEVVTENGENTLLVAGLNALQSYTFTLRATSPLGVSRPISTSVSTPAGPPAVLDSRVDVDHLPHRIAVWFDQPVEALGGLSASDGELRAPFGTGVSADRSATEQ
ncbi:MAG: fibronectin type III domain-containing protein [Tepidisphaeraceae bacterium]